MGQHGSRAGGHAEGEPDAPRFAGNRRRSRSWPCPHPADFAILVVHEVHDVTLQLSGHLSDASRTAFERCVDAALADRPRRLVLELSALEGTDGTGVESIIGARDRAAAVGVGFVLDSPSLVVRDLLVEGSVDEAFAIR